MDIISQTVQDIKSLKIQGATNIVKTSLNALSVWSSEEKTFSINDFKKKAESLYKARPTEPFVTNVLIWTIKKLEGTGLEKTKDVLEEQKKYLQEITEKIIDIGASSLEGKKIILTHCHSSNVEEIIKRLHKKDNTIEVFATITEPLHQGEITAKNLSEFGVKVTMITDGEAAFMISHEDNQKINVVLIGADVILKDGSVINKVGSYGIALSAGNANIPLYVIASLLKFTPDEIKIEERNGNEIWDNPPKGVKIFNPAFDKVPEKFITGIITEEGIIKPNKVEETVRNLYPWIFT